MSEVQFEDNNGLERNWAYTNFQTPSEPSSMIKLLMRWGVKSESAAGLILIAIIAVGFVISGYLFFHSSGKPVIENPKAIVPR